LRIVLTITLTTEQRCSNSQITGDYKK